MYASNTFLLIFLTSALASLAVALITSSTSLARTSFSKSGGLKQFKHARTLSAAVTRKLADLSLDASNKYGKIAGSCVCSMTARIHVRARVIMTLLVRVQRVKSVGKNRDKRGSNSAPRSEANAHSRSIAAPESLLRSEHMALLRGRENVRIDVMSSAEKSQAPFLQRYVKRTMPFAMISHDSSDSTRVKAGRRASTSLLKVFGESHYRSCKTNMGNRTVTRTLVAAIDETICEFEYSHLCWYPT